jgi:RNA polymerase II subunit A small phosphatase-like protein
LKDHFQVAVWSSASDDYVQKVVEMIFPQEYPLLFVWGRSRCIYKPDYNAAEDHGYFDFYKHYDYIKPIDKVKRRFGISKDRILIIDDTPKKCVRNFGNAIYPAEFKGHAEDNELQLLHQYLLTLKDLESVRSIEKRQWKQQVERL